MRIVIHGATNGTNFGDILFGHLFYRKCQQVGHVDVDFLNMRKYGIGNFLRRELDYSRKLSAKDYLKADMLVMMSGGYLGEDKVSWLLSIKRYFRYILPARLFQLQNKPVLILGAGGGPIDRGFLRRATVRLLNKAALVHVRDEETRDYFVRYGVKRDMVVTSDTAQVITKECVPELQDEELRQFCNERKVIFVHAVTGAADEKFAEIVIPALNRFLADHAEYGVVFGSDEWYSHKTMTELKSYQALKAKHIRLAVYRSSWQLCALLSNVDFVVTAKLHVGIVSASIAKSVVSFPIHREKTQRYYRQIGEENRSIHLSKATQEQAYALLNRYHDVPIILSEEIRKKASMNLEAIGEYIAGCDFGD